VDRPAPVSSRRPWGRRVRRTDLLFGVLLPLICLVADPGVLRPGSLLLSPLWPERAVATYVFIALAIAALVSWRVWRNGALLVVGPLFVGALGALAIGLVLLPLSVICAFMLIGLLGLVPFGTALAFFGNGKQAWRAARAVHSRTVVLATSVLLGASLLAVSLGAQRLVDRRAVVFVEAAVAGDAQALARADARLRPFGPLVDRQIGWDAWADAADPEVKRRVRNAWLRATGQDLDDYVGD
jgi:hypothetical protein